MPRRIEGRGAVFHWWLNPSHVWNGWCPYRLQNRSYWSLDALCLRGENFAESSIHERRSDRVWRPHDHCQTGSYFTNTILRRASRNLYILTRAVAANRLWVRIARTLEKPRLLAKFFTENFFEEFLFSKLINNAVVDDFRCESIGSNAFHLIEFQ